MVAPSAITAADFLIAAGLACIATDCGTTIGEAIAEAIYGPQQANPPNPNRSIIPPVPPPNPNSAAAGTGAGAAANPGTGASNDGQGCSSKSKDEECYEKCKHLLPSPTGDLQASEFRKCYRECKGSL